MGKDLWSLATAERARARCYRSRESRRRGHVRELALRCFVSGRARRGGLRRVPRVAIPVLHIEQEWANNPSYPRMLRDCDGVIVCTDAERDFVQARGGTDDLGRRRRSGPEPFRAPRRRPHQGSLRHRRSAGRWLRRKTGHAKRRSNAHRGDARRLAALPDAMLLMAGQSAHREPAVTKMLSELSAADRARVVLIDDFPDEDGPSIMDACDLLALPSVEESFGLVMIEAWMCGKPVIGADIASTRCIIESRCRRVDREAIRLGRSGDKDSRPTRRSGKARVVR